MSAYSWIITRDHMSEPGDKYDEAGVMGPGNTTLTAEEIITGPSIVFRMLDDDGEVMYTGTYLGDPDSADLFGPLDDFGTPNAGCTTIQYKKGGKFTTI